MFLALQWRLGDYGFLFLYGRISIKAFFVPLYRKKHVFHSRKTGFLFLFFSDFLYEVLFCHLIEKLFDIFSIEGVNSSLYRKYTSSSHLKGFR